MVYLPFKSTSIISSKSILHLADGRNTQFYPSANCFTFWAKDSLEIKKVIAKRRDILKRSNGYNFEKQ
jgi:hypothetical protein